MNVNVALPPEALEAIAQRAAELVAEREQDTGWLDVAGAAEHLACPRSRVYSLVSARRLPCERDGSRLLFDREALDAWVRAGGAKRP